MVEYEHVVVSRASYDLAAVELREFTNEMIRDGWTPVGGISISPDPSRGDVLMGQVMTREKETE